MVFRIAYGAGHGLHTPGKRTPDGEREWTFNNKVVRAFEDEIKNYENVALLRTDDPTGQRDVPLKERTDKANNWGADVYWSSHHNAIKGEYGNWTGTETFYHKNSSKGKRLAQLVQDAQLKAYGLRSRGIKTANLHITRETKMPAVLSEGAFMDSYIDIKKMRDDNVLKQAGINIARAIAEYGNLKRKDGNEPKPVVPAQSSSKPARKSNSAIAQEVIDGKWGNNPQRKQRLESAGYNYNAIQAEVNKRLGGGSTKKSAPKRKTVDTVAQEVIDGKWGNNPQRRNKLTSAGYNYSQVQKRVNELLGGGSSRSSNKSISQMATEILRGDHGNGHETRRKSLGIDQATYQKVRAEVNRRA